jgi:uncharacterized protein
VVCNIPFCRLALLPAVLLTLLAAMTAATICQADTLSILSQNMYRLYDDVDDGNKAVRLSRAAFDSRVEKAATRFASDFGLPQIIALQEIENINVLRRIAKDLREQYGTEYRAALIPGNDISSSNIGFLVQDSFRIARIEQLFREQRLGNGTESLFSRPPLLLEACGNARCITLLNLHLRSMRGINNASQSGRVARKRRQQAETVALWAHQFQQQKPQADLLLLGDFNALTPADEHVDIAGILRGSPDNSRSRLYARDLLDPDLIDLTHRIPLHRRYSYIFRQRRQQLDYMFSNATLADRIEHIVYSPIDYPFSDHAGLLARFRW